MHRTANATFADRVFAVVADIPSGETMSYKAVAERAGNPAAARAVGSILKTNYDPRIPCHRVVRCDGEPGGYNRGDARKRALLTREARRAPRGSRPHAI